MDIRLYSPVQSRRIMVRSYQLGWKNKAAARASLNKILAWDFDKIVLSHGDNITDNAKEKARQAWTPPLEKPPSWE